MEQFKQTNRNSWNSKSIEKLSKKTGEAVHFRQDNIVVLFNTGN